MEDEVSLVPVAKHGYLYAGVFDGHGGELAARWLRRELYPLLSTALDDPAFSEPGHDVHVLDTRHRVVLPRRKAEALTAVFRQADALLLKHITDSKGKVSGASGSTATLVLLNDVRAVVASIGDSSAVLSRNGVPVALTQAHRVYGSGHSVRQETQRITDAGGWVHEGRVCNVLAVSRAFGDWEFKGQGLQVLLREGIAKGLWSADFAARSHFTGDPVIVDPDVREVELQPEDEFLIVASDGLWDFTPPAEAVKWARREFKAGKDATAVAASLCDLALRRYSSDNVAVVVVDLKPPGHWSAKKHASDGGGGLFGLFK